MKKALMKMHLPTLRVGIAALLLPALLLLPTLHMHPAYGHVHGQDEAHTHSSVLHADFLAVAAHEH
jgi:hypothetical protein